MALGDIIHDVADEIGVTAPTALVGSRDPTARRLVAVAQAEGEHLYSFHDWSILHREFPFTTEAGEANYAVPDDFGRIVSRTAWDQTQFRQMRGSMTPQQWQRHQNAVLAPAGLLKHFRTINGPLAGSILIYPTPTAAEALICEYISDQWCESAAGEGQSRWLADSDEFRIHHEVFKLGLLWRARRAFGLSYADERNDAEEALRDAVIDDLALGMVSTAPEPPRSRANLAEGSWFQ